MNCIHNQVLSCIGTAHRERRTMAYTCVLAPSHECDGCQDCEDIRKSKEQQRWDKYEAEYNYYRDEAYIREEEQHDR